MQICCSLNTYLLCCSGWGDWKALEEKTLDYVALRYSHFQHKVPGSRQCTPGVVAQLNLSVCHGIVQPSSIRVMHWHKECVVLAFPWFMHVVVYESNPSFSSSLLTTVMWSTCCVIWQCYSRASSGTNKATGAWPRFDSLQGLCTFAFEAFS